MDDWTKRRVVADLTSSRDLINATLVDEELLLALVRTCNLVSEALSSGRKILIAGNGGSAADAQHIAGEFVSRFNFDRAPLPAIALTTDTSILTSIGNDYGFEHLFSRQVRALGQRGDVLIGISTSGRSANVLAGLRAAREAGLITVGFTGQEPGEMGALCQETLKVPSRHTPFIQQVHITFGHIVCAIAEERIFGDKSARETI